MKLDERAHIGHSAVVSIPTAVPETQGNQIALHRFRGERRQVFVTLVERGVATAVTDGSEDEPSPE